MVWWRGDSVMMHSMGLRCARELGLYVGGVRTRLFHRTGVEHDEGARGIVWESVGRGAMRQRFVGRIVRMSTVYDGSMWS